MNTEKRRPSWWQLWLLLPALAILGFLEARASLSPAGHRAAEVVIILVIYGLVSGWLRANRATCLRETRDQVIWREVGKAADLPLAPGTIAGNNGDGHRESTWYLPMPEPDADLVTAHEEWDK